MGPCFKRAALGLALAACIACVLACKAKAETLVDVRARLSQDEVISVVLQPATVVLPGALING